MHLGIDLGTSAVKVALVDADRSVVATGMSRLETSCRRPGWSEQGPDIWWIGLKEALGQLGDDRAKASAIGLSGQMHGAVLLGRDKSVLRSAILWNDSRAHAEAEAISRETPEAAMLAGVRPMPGFTAPKIRWLAEHEPDIHASIAHILSPKDWIGLRLHGEVLTDPSDAAGTFWLDQASRDWSDTLCDLSMTDRDWLPPIRPGMEIAGRLRDVVADELGLPPGIPVAVGAGDAVAGAVAVGATRDATAFLSIGTSAQLFIATDSYRPNPEQMVHAFAHTLPDLWYRMAAMLNGAAPMSWFAGITGTPVGDLLGEAALAVPGRAPRFLPYLTGERSPHGDPHIRGAFDLLDASTTRGEMIRGIVEAIAFSFADAFASCQTSLPEPPLALGGGARSDLLLQMIADVNQTPIARSAGAETGPAFGAARLAAVATGDLGLGDLARRPDVSRLFEPNPPDAGLNNRLEDYRALYRRLKPLRR